MLLPWIRKRSFTPSLSFDDRTKAIALIVFSVLIFLFFFLNPKLSEKIKISFFDYTASTIDFINRPFKKMSNEITSISSVSELKAENERLKIDNERLKDWYQTALMLQAKNRSLETLLNLKSDHNFDFITAQVLIYPQSAHRSGFLVKLGEQSGIKKDDIVLSGDGLIGRVSNIGQKVTRVLPVTDINSRIPVFVEGTNKQAIAAGQLEERITLKHYDFNLADMQGKKIYTSGDGGIFPSGLLVGTITSYRDSIIIEPAVSLRDLEFVKIMKSQNVRLDDIEGLQ